MKILRWAMVVCAVFAATAMLVAGQAPGAASNLHVGGNLTVITSPTQATTYDNGTTATVTVSGVASSDRPLTACTWVNSLGGSGTATGTTSWTVSGLALTVGSNVITVTCTNISGAVSLDVITVTRSSSGFTCTTTLSSGGNIASAATAAASGSTICLNTGTYGTASISGSTKSPRVTIRANTGATVTVGNLNFTGGANGFTVIGVTSSGGNIGGSTTRNITLQSITFTGQYDIDTNSFNNNNILVDSSSFIGISVCGGCSEGRLQIAWAGGPGSVSSGVTVSNSLFENSGCSVGESDGIQVGAYGVVIGPGNIFRNIRQCSFGRHVDALQLYGQSHTTITGNLFIGNTTHVMAPDGGNTEIFTHNVVCNSESTSSPFQLGDHDNNTITHNTFVGSCGGSGSSFTVNIDQKTDAPDDPSENVLFRDNIMRGVSMTLDCDSCTITHNMFSSGGSGTNNIIASPTFTGGTNPSTYAGFQLTAASAGYQVATDPAGTDMGVTYSGSPPSAMRLVPFLRSFQQQAALMAVGFWQPRELRPAGRQAGAERVRVP